MEKPHEFWRRQVTDTLSVELVPGDRPSLSIIKGGNDLVTLELPEARALIEALNVAVGELFILIKDPATLAQVERLLAEDVTLVLTDGDRTASAENTKPVKSRELLRRYKKGERSFPKANLREADLSKTDLSVINLRGAEMIRTNLEQAILCQANLEKATLIQANLVEANLLQANLLGADLSQANLKDAQVTDKQLVEAKSLRGTIMPDGTKHC